MALETSWRSSQAAKPEDAIGPPAENRSRSIVAFLGRANTNTKGQEFKVFPLSPDRVVPPREISWSSQSCHQNSMIS
jgi:hypothetical protein